ncbi:ABC transporter permease [Burkholderia multivorans]|nr:ABC transporter permease [Burkholderia multivorans]VWB64443.1 ABC-2 type transporter [Burkholderia ubonensis]
MHILSFLRVPFKNRYLLTELIKRDISIRYRGSLMGIMWAVVNPLLMLVVYTFFFSVVFKARWSTAGDSKGDFAMLLFCGLLVFNFLGECLNRSPALILSNSNYVKKVVFPLEVLPWVVVGSALFHAVIGFGVWFSFFVVVKGYLHWTSMLLPVVLLPIIFFAAGFSWLLSSFGVYLRDIGQFVTILTAVLPFTSPIFFPITALPENFQVLMYINPLTVVIDQVRSVLFFGVVPSGVEYVVYLAISLIFAFLCFVWFQKTRRGFADVM